MTAPKSNIPLYTNPAEAAFYAMDKTPLEALSAAADAIIAGDALPGPTGPIGPTGPKGDTGAAGGVGDKGPTGDKGATGDAGAAGATGDKGATGDAGTNGSPADAVAALLASLPTVDPAVAGALWNSSGTFMVSAG